MRKIIENRFDSLYKELKQEIYANENSIDNFTQEMNSAVLDIKSSI